IEARLVEHPQASDVVVVASRGDGEEEDGDERLVTYVIEKRRDDTPLYQALRAFLATKLPAYIVPASFVRMDSFPLTTSGKLNRLALPASTMTSTNMDAAVAHAGYEPLRGPIESAIALVWMDLLRVARIRRHDDFFAIGGHSLLGVKMIGRLRPILGSRGDKGETMISLRTMFEAPTIAQMPPSASSELFEASFQALLPIRPSGTRAPLFCIHPGPQLVLQRSDKTSCEDQPPYGLQACGFGEGEAPAATLAEMVEDYIVQVRSVQPSGPYHLLEYSFGGLVTHTMATKLKMGERVAFWTVMDTSAGYAAARAAQEKAKEKKEEEFDVTAARRIFQMDEDYETDLTLSFLERATRVLENNIRSTRSAEASPQSLLVFGGDFLVLRAIVLEEGVEAVKAESGGRMCKEKSRLWMLSVHTTR
ncbi:MAG: Alpha/Beta hydrolase protein, partial [Podila humilis]